MIELPVSLWASAIQITVGLWKQDKNDYSECDMIFDTGAYMTSIDTSIAKRLGIKLFDVEDSIITGVGSGSIPAKHVILPGFRLGNYFELGPVLVNVFDFPVEMATPALLGLNIIKEFKISIDFTDKRIVGIDRRDATIFMEPNFDSINKPTFTQFDKNSSRFGLWLVTEYS